LLQSSPEFQLLASTFFGIRRTRRRTTLPWGLLPLRRLRREQRPTLGLPHPAVLRLQAFSTS
jgi:hypothetical protein